jgi:hypothetical protein
MQLFCWRVIMITEKQIYSNPYPLIIIQYSNLSSASQRREPSAVAFFFISFLDVMKLKAGIKTATNSRCIYWEQLDQIDART